MPVIDLHLYGDNAWPDLQSQDVIHLPESPIGMAVLDGGMQSGKPSIALRFDFEGKTLVAETSWAVLAATVKAVAARYGWPE